MASTDKASQPIKASSPKAIAPNLNALSDLSSSSTGRWERGAQTNNARSPPTHPSVLSERAARRDKEKQAHPLQFGGSETVPTPPTTANRGPGQVAMPPGAPIYPRQAREGYGFRPASGQSTPTGLGGNHSFAPFPSMGHSRHDEDDMDHRPDGRSMASLQAEVRQELIEGGLIEGSDDEVAELQRATEGLGIASGGIADEQGLGWAGEWPLTILWMSIATSVG